MKKQACILLAASLLCLFSCTQTDIVTPQPDEVKSPTTYRLKMSSWTDSVCVHDDELIYDNLGRATKDGLYLIDYKTEGFVTEILNNQIKIVDSLDANGLIKSSKSFELNTNPNSGGKVTINTFEYDAKNRLILRKENTSETVSTFTYENDRLVKSSQESSLPNSTNVYQTYEYQIDVKNTIADKFKGQKYRGEKSAFLPTKVTQTFKYKGVENVYVEMHTYSLNSAGQVSFDKAVFSGKNVRRVTLTTYTYE